MTRTVFLVRLRDGFNRSDYDSTCAEYNANPNIRIFATSEAATAYVRDHSPVHNPFNTQCVDFDYETRTVTVDETPDETHWEFYVGADGTLNDLSEPPDEAHYDAIIPRRRIPEPLLIAAIEKVGLPAPKSPSLWQDWWNETVPIMTDRQRAAVWHVLTENPYLILKLEAEI